MKAAEIAASCLDLRAEVATGGRSAEEILDLLLLPNPQFCEARGESKVERIEAHDISGTKGYCSNIFRTTVGFAEADRPAYSFVMKIPSSEKILRLLELCGVDESFVELNVDERNYAGRHVDNYHTCEEAAKRLAKGANLLLDYENGELKEDLQKLLEMDWYKFSSYCLYDRADEFNAVTLVHDEDFWTNNVMFRVHADGSTSDQIAALIDWQSIFDGSPLFDVARFFVISADAEVRREAERTAVDVFFDRLSENFRKDGRSPRFTREQASGRASRRAHELYELAVAHQVGALVHVFSVVGLPAARSDSPVERANAEKLWLRLRLAVEDQRKFFEKHGLLVVFRKRSERNEFIR
ncbi:hypothetical protein M3Y99_00146900 [Aphelenchoides fujianensis]|nr:hypothetical protein M3Y99_00294900 [Aphelenchoides fujianensis]KAI6243226.1 hypothetical protein M3Y99_00146900 [Aphelenchoides fujianensis]